MANCLVCVAMATGMGVAVGWGDFSGSPSLTGEQASCHCERERVGDRKKKQALKFKFKLCKNHRYRRTAVGLPGRGVCPAGEHREVQQPPLRKEQERRFRARGQLPAERAGPARRAAGGLPLQLRDVAGERGLLAADPVGGATTESIT